MPGKGRYIDLVGRMFGRLRVVRPAGRPRGRTLWECICLCGATGVIANGDKLQRGSVASCGCLKREQAIVNGAKSPGPIRHGATKGGAWTPEYKAWAAMINRCRPTAPPKTRELYFGRGIRACARWLDFPAFLEDMGSKPTPQHTLDRIDNSKGYEPGNCHWATPKQQAANRRRRRSTAEVKQARERRAE